MYSSVAVNSDDDDDPLLQTLRQALAHAISSDEGLRIYLAIELRTHLLSTISQHQATMHRLRKGQQQAQAQLQTSKEAQKCDHQKLIDTQTKGTRLFGLHAAATGKRRDAEDAVKFSTLMVERSEGLVEKSDKAVREERERFGMEAERLRREFRLAAMACRDVLARMPQGRRASALIMDQGTDDVEPDTRPRPPPPPPPPPPPTSRPASANTPWSQPIQTVAPKHTSTYTRHNHTLNRNPNPNPKQPPPPPAPPPLPSSQRPFSITADMSYETMQAQQRFQHTVPRQCLIPFDPHTSQSSSITDDAMLLGHVQRLLFSRDLWSSIQTMISSCIPQVSEPSLIPGIAGHGADAYISLKLTDTSLVRLPIATIATFTKIQNSGHGKSSTASNARAIKDIFGTSTLHSYDARVVESNVKKLVSLISTENSARNAGILVAVEGMLFVRRVSSQGVKVSRLVRFDTSAEGSEWNCHPIAAIGQFVLCVLFEPFVSLPPPLFL